MKIIISSQNKVLSDNVVLADTPLKRLIGFMFQQKPKDYDGIMIEPCRSIHTFFMRFPLDVIFISKSGVVIKIIRNLKPWRMTWIYFRAHKVLELPAGKLSMDVMEGHTLEVRSV